MSQPTFYKMRGQGGKKVHMGLLIVIVLVALSRSSAGCNG